MKLEHFNTPQSAALEDIEPWQPVVTQVRDAILAHMITGAHFAGAELPPEGRAMLPTQGDVNGINNLAYEAVSNGRLIDFGEWTNAVIMHGGNRGGPLYTKGVIGHPFRQPYVYMHTWEGETAVYLVNPLEPEKAAGDCEAIELNPMRVNRRGMLSISDRAVLWPGESGDGSKYHCSAMASPWRYLPGAEAINNGMAPVNAAAGNVLDPLMTALLILSTRGIDRHVIAPSDKLQKAREKNRKPPIPPHEAVNSAGYVTAISNRIARGRSESRGGTHASPQPHLRMGHPRTYANGVTTFVRDALVGFSDEARAAFRSNRSHYVVRKGL